MTAADAAAAFPRSAVASSFARQLVADYVEHRLNRQGLPVPPEIGVRRTADEDGQRNSRIRLALRDLGDEFERRYSEVFSEMCSPLNLTDTDAESTFRTIVDHLFEGTINWGRIVGLFAFCGRLAAYCVGKDMPSIVDQFVNWSALYIDNNLSLWIEKNGGWDGLLDFYQNREDSHNGEWSWPCISSLCGYVFSAVGVLTLTAVLSRK